MLFDFNPYSSLLLPSFLQGLLFFFILLWQGFRHERLPDKLLAIILLVYTLKVTSWMLGFAGWYDSHDWHTSFMFYFEFNHWLAVGPLFYFYLISLTNSQFKWQRKYWWHFLPEGVWVLRGLSIFVVDVGIQHWGKGLAFPLFYETHGDWFENGFGFSDQFWPYLETLSIFAYIIMSLRLYKQYRVYISQNFSDTGSIHFRWLRNSLIAMAVGHLVWIGFDLVDAFSVDGLSYIEDWYSFFFLGILIYYLSLAGFANGAVERPQLDLHFDPSSTDEETATAPLEREMADWKIKIGEAMSTQKPYLQSDLSLSQFAAMLNTSPATLSKAINAGFQKNFNEFINGYRVEEVKGKLADPAFAHLTVLAIGLNCGFSSKATFNRVFKKMERASPSEFMAAIN